jgi:hypothetical protein
MVATFAMVFQLRVVASLRQSYGWQAGEALKQQTRATRL